MSLAERLLRLASAFLPRRHRDARLEEWLADLEGATEAGLPRRSVVVGAWRFALTVGIWKRVAGIRPRALLVGVLVTLGIALVAVPVVGAAGMVLANMRGVVTVETASDGSEQLVHWRDYPGVAGLDPAEVLAGPSLAEGERIGEALVAELREALGAEHGLSWRHAPQEATDPQQVRNRYGGVSMLFLVNAQEWQSQGVPATWTDTEAVIETIRRLAAEHGLGRFVLDHERPGITEAELIRDFGAADPENMVFLSGVALGPAGNWLAFTVQNLAKDHDGSFAERFSAVDHGWEPDRVTLMYGANALLAEADRAEFLQRLQPFAGIEQPEPLVSE